MSPEMNDFLMHEGRGHEDNGHSGRYEWGSGDNPYQHVDDFLGRVNQLKREHPSFYDEATGKTYSGDTAVAKLMGMSSKQFRAQMTLANEIKKRENYDKAAKLQAEGKGATEIGRIMGVSESTVRGWLNAKSLEKMEVARTTADFLREQVDKKKIVDIGTGVSDELGISSSKMDAAVQMLEMQGYKVYSGRYEQVTNPGKFTTIKTLCAPNTKYSEIYDPDKVHSLKDYIHDDLDDSFRPKFVYPESMDSKRMKIRYAEEGGIDKDGLVEIRRGVEDLNLGNSTYAQVRILVDGTHYIKGMAAYSDDLPKGVDVVFNTNKPVGTPLTKVLKPISNNPDNPFKSLIKEGVVDPKDPTTLDGGQSYYYDKNGNKKLSLINKRAEEGDWGEWADKLPSQFLAKQSKALVKNQLKISENESRTEFETIKKLTNPNLRKELLMDFADGCDTAAIHLKAASLPRQKWQVILPLTSIKDTEVYAPNYNHGEKVALVRYPHGGKFEIPILTVNNKNEEGKRIMTTNPKDAVGISSKVAGILSGADFDGDTVMVIPLSGKITITNQNPLAGLKDFDPKMAYGGRPEGTFKKMTKKDTQLEMGIISNLITDMTLKGATEDDLAKAVRHSMVVIDAEKHNLDYKASERDNDIKSLKRKYQTTIDENGNVKIGGASTILSLAKNDAIVVKRQGDPIIDKETGKVSYKIADDAEYVDRKGNVKYRVQKSTKMAETDDAFTLVSDYSNPIEVEYAKYANAMKQLANDARKEAVNMVLPKKDPVAAKTYAREVAELNYELMLAKKNKPKERLAQILATSRVRALEDADPTLSDNKAELKKEKQRALVKARMQVGAARHSIKVTDAQWEAIQAGAVAPSVLSSIFNYADKDDLKKRAMPRDNDRKLSSSQVGLIKTLAAAGYTNADIAKRLGVSASSVSSYLK